MNKEDIKRTLKISGLVVLLVISFSLGGLYQVNKLLNSSTVTVLTDPAVVIPYSDDEIRDLAEDLDEILEQEDSSVLQSDEVKSYKNAKQDYENELSTVTMTQLFVSIMQVWVKLFSL